MIFLLFAASFATGFFAFYLIFRLKKGGFHAVAKALLQQAEWEAEKRKMALEALYKEKELNWQKEKDRTSHQLKRREEELTSLKQSAEKKKEQLEKKEHLLREEEKSLSEMIQRAKTNLEKQAEFSKEEAKSLLLADCKREIADEAADFSMKLRQEVASEVDREAQKLLVMTMNRLSATKLNEHTLITVYLPNDEMKRRIIGREGRNIRTLENLTGVNFLFDDTPGAIVISSFDPIRKHVAKLTLTDLIKDGRIHPTRIEEAFQTASQQIDKEIKEKGSLAANVVGVHGLSGEILYLLGTLSFEEHFGHNVLDHSIEVAKIMGLMASECGLNEEKAKRIGLLHDIGKALKEGTASHALAGFAFLCKHGEREDVAAGVGAHHGEMSPMSLEGALCEVANRLSSERMGARHLGIEQSLKRQKKLEQVTSEFSGVEKVFALQAGKELRVIVEPDKINERQAHLLARDIAKRIAEEITFSGKIKVTVIRESKFTEYAS